LQPARRLRATEPARPPAPAGPNAYPNRNTLPGFSPVWNLAESVVRAPDRGSAASLALYQESLYMRHRAMWRRWLPLVLSLIGVLAHTSEVRAWGCLAHIIIGQIAADQLSAEAREAVADLLGGHSLADVSCWADEVR